MLEKGNGSFHFHQMLQVGMKKDIHFLSNKEHSFIILYEIICATLLRYSRHLRILFCFTPANLVNIFISFCITVRFISSYCSLKSRNPEILCPLVHFNFYIHIYNYRENTVLYNYTEKLI